MTIKIRRPLVLVFFAIQSLFAINCQAQEAARSRYVRQANKDSVVVFVHGVLGDSRSTWTNDTTKSYWPDLMKDDPYFKDFDIFVVAYPSSFFHSDYTTDELVEVLRRDLDSAEVFSKHKHVYFLCHSMGGLVVRGYLTRYRNRASQVPMIYFFSTPTAGADIAGLARFLSRNPQMRALLPLDVNDYLASIRNDWLAAQFSIASYCAYETQDTDGIRVVVETSATTLCNRPLDPINADHLTIVKPSDIHDAPYASFRNALQEVLQAIPKEAHQPPRQDNSFAVEIFTDMLVGGDWVGPSPFLWFVDRADTVVFPIDALIAVQITNLRSVPAEIDRFSFEVKANKGWVDLDNVSFGSGQGEVYEGSMENPVQITIAPGDISDLLQGNSIAPGRTVRAIGLFQYSTRIVSVPNKVPKFRVTLHDTADHTSVYELSFPGGRWLSGRVWLNGVMFSVTGKHLDLRGLRVQKNY